MATQVEKIIEKSKELLGTSYIEGGMTYCQRFVRHCYEAAGLSGSAGSAMEAGNKWIVSNSKDNIPVGAAVYFTNNNSNGHVGIYIGNGKMRHVWTKGKVCETSIDVASGYRGWGWQGGVQPSGVGIDVAMNNSSGISYNTLKSSTANIPDFNKAAKADTLGLSSNKGLTLKIIHDNIVYDATDLCQDSIQLVTKRKANPAKLTFKIARDIATGKIAFYEGDAVALMYDDIGMFWGYIFKKSRNKEQVITVTAYDQLRYFKNKETYCYSKTADELLKMICDDFNLQTGLIDKTNYIINNRVEDNVALWDIIYNALDITNIYTGKYFNLYDDFGDVTLKSYDNMRLPLAFVSDDNTLIDFSYSSDIDADTYNRIVLYKDDKDTGSRALYIAQDTLSMMRWGVLQHTEKVGDHYSDSDIQSVCERLLTMKNRVKKSFTIEDKGNPQVRAGCGIWVQTEVTGEILNCGAVVESCTHAFKNNEHSMKLEITCEEVS